MCMIYCTEIFLSWDVNIITAPGLIITSVTSVLTALLNTNKSWVIFTARLLLWSNRYLKIFNVSIWKAKWFTVTRNNNIPASYIYFRETFIIFQFDNSHKATYFLKLLRIKTSARGDQNIFGNLLNLLLRDNRDLWDWEIYNQGENTLELEEVETDRGVDMVGRDPIALCTIYTR